VPGTFEMAQVGVRAAVVLAAVLLLATTAAVAQDTRLKEVERALQADRAKADALARQAQALKDEIQTLRRDMVAAAQTAQDLEEALSATEQALIELEAERNDKLADLQEQRDRLARTLGALQRIALRPPEVALAAPGSPVDTLRSARLLSVAVPIIERRGRVLRAELVALDRLHREIALKQDNLAAQTQNLEAERGRLARLIERKRGLEDVTSAEQRAARARVRKLANEAKDLRDFVAKLEREAQQRAERQAREAAEREAREAAERQAREAAERAAREAREAATEEGEPRPRDTQQALLARPQPPTPLERPGNVRAFPQSPATAALVMPARGRVIATFGEEEPQGATTSKGISILTRGSAQVVAPYDGRVRYAGTFRRYGQILIIEHGERYHTILAGLDRIDAVAGQWVLAGEPVGVMSRGESSGPVLYLELRRSGQPINPLPWLATTSDKVQG
jgi:septal ring factor EnvC (AmiA/AmiB activator)